MYYQALNSLTSSNHDLQDYTISHTVWAIINKIAEFLKPFKDLTIKMSTSSCSTSFYVIPLFNIIFDHIESAELMEGGSGAFQVKMAAKAGREKLVRYYSKTNIMTMLCTVLDPRRKFNYFTKKGFSDDEIMATQTL